MPQTVVEKKKYTYEDYLDAPEDKRYELIQGELLMTPAPAPRHQKILGSLYTELRNFVVKDALGDVLLAPCDVHLDNENVVQPDILFIAKDRLDIIGEKNIQGAPDLVVEIISESTAYRDLVQKKCLYAQHGVKEYWVVVPEEKMIEVYVLRETLYGLHKTFRKGDSLDSPTFPDLRISLANVFEG
jgi:Uma2 family endonuclease